MTYDNPERIFVSKIINSTKIKSIFIICDRSEIGLSDFSEVL